jgi:thiol-disulfide isomerase/thioredoxin
MKNTTKTIIGIVIFVAFLGLAYWGYTFLSESFNPKQNESENTAPSQAIDLQTAPDFTVFDQEENPVNLSDFSGKPVVLNFWASWCPPCKDEMPYFNSAYQDQKDEIVFLMVNQTDGQRETKEKALQYVTDQGFTFPIYFDTELEASIAYGASALPTTLFINADGKIVSGYQGAIDKVTLQKGIDSIKN